MREAWRIALASEIGTSHAATAAPCQDYASAVVINSLDGPLLVAVVADGAGSAARSEIGSHLVCTTLIETVALFFSADRRLSELNNEVARSWIKVVVDAMVDRAASECRPVNDYASTMLAAIIGPAEAAFLQIGDGAIVISRDAASTEWDYVFWPQHGEFANATNFVTSKGATELLEFEFLARRVGEVALFSDGIENLVLHHASRTVHKPFFDLMFKPVRESGTDGVDIGLCDGLRRYLAMPHICERTDDDKTLVLATRASVDVGERAPCPTS